MGPNGTSDYLLIQNRSFHYKGNVQGPRRWFAKPSLYKRGMGMMMGGEKGQATFCGWDGMLSIGAQTQVHGLLGTPDHAYDPVDMSAIIRWPEECYRLAIAFATQPRLEWLIKIPYEQAQQMFMDKVDSAPTPVHPDAIEVFERLEELKNRGASIKYEEFIDIFRQTNYCFQKVNKAHIENALRPIDRKHWIPALMTFTEHFSGQDEIDRPLYRFKNYLTREQEGKPVTGGKRGKPDYSGAST